MLGLIAFRPIYYVPWRLVKNLQRNIFVIKVLMSDAEMFNLRIKKIKTIFWNALKNKTFCMMCNKTKSIGSHDTNSNFLQLPH